MTFGNLHHAYKIRIELKYSYPNPSLSHNNKIKNQVNIYFKNIKIGETMKIK